MKPLPGKPLLAVVGTDTGVGKTVVCAGLLKGLSRMGCLVAGYKPVETGIPDPHKGAPQREAVGELPDWERLERASGQGKGTALGMSFPLPAAPLVASRAAGRTISPQLLWDQLSGLRRDHELVILEGAGGLLVPLAEELLWGDFLGRLGPRCLVVSRLGLGSINHTLLTLEALRQRKLPIVGVILNATQPPGPEATHTPNLISLFGNIAVFTIIPHGLIEPARVADHLSSCGLLDLLYPRSPRS